MLSDICNLLSSRVNRQGHRLQAIGLYCFTLQVEQLGPILINIHRSNNVECLQTKNRPEGRLCNIYRSGLAHSELAESLSFFCANRNEIYSGA